MNNDSKLLAQLCYDEGLNNHEYAEYKELSDNIKNLLENIQKFGKYCVETSNF